MTQNFGTLYIVATPIGNLGDLSQRAIETLQQVDLIAVEDTRHSGKLLHHFNIQTPMIPLHEYNERERSDKLLERLKQGKNIALISDAGTPLISDPGFHLVHSVRKSNIKVTPIPGACAAIAALSVSGLPSDQFVFEGFLSSKQIARLKRLEALKNEVRTMIFYEAPHRIVNMLEDMVSVFGEDRQVVIVRELTKLYETVYDDKLSAVLTCLKAHPKQQVGEFVVLVSGAEKMLTDDAEVERILKILLEECSTSQAAKLAAKITGGKKNALYDLALGLCSSEQ
ncbi:MAG: 16S rRNA (cytidine(1402)-2'-O)-methyltransferase [Pseudomonadota bacterium]